MIDTLLAGRELLAILPTGAGKSVCFQVPALLLPRYTLVVSPLMALMRDQVQHLHAHGVPAAAIDSGCLDGGRQALRDVVAGRVKLLYVAPERLQNAAFLKAVAQVPPAAVIVDEAHTTEWARSFRPSYHDIRQFVEALPARPRFAAFTATATPDARRFIIDTLGLRTPKVLVGGFDRPNLYLRKASPANKDRALLAELARHPGECGIVYCGTRNAVQQVTALLQSHGYDAIRYHAGLTHGERAQARERFTAGGPVVVVCTNAFGMGIDRPDVRFVIHYQLPGSLAGYYQEAGRAGRDGKPSECLLLYSRKDLDIQRYLLTQNATDGSLGTARSAKNRVPDTAHAAANGAPDPESAAALDAMWAYAQTDGCLRHFLLRYFGETPPAGGCGHCSNCTGTSIGQQLTSFFKKIF